MAGAALLGPMKLRRWLTLRRTIKFAKGRTETVQEATYNGNGGLGVTEFAPVAFPFSLQLRQETAKGLLGVQ